MAVQGRYWVMQVAEVTLHSGIGTLGQAVRHSPLLINHTISHDFACIYKSQIRELRPAMDHILNMGLLLLRVSLMD